MKIMIIANPNAGGFRKVSMNSIKNYLEEKGADVTVYWTVKKGDAKDHAANIKEGEYDVVVAAGGDGTVNEVINGIAKKKINFGVIPAGTVNVFAIETGIPFDSFKACDVILQNNTKKINLGIADDRYFVLMASAGFDAYVAYNIHAGLKSVAGRLGFVLHGIFLLLFYKFPKIKITTGHGTYYGYTVIVSNMKMYAGKIHITPNASFLSNDFEVCILTKKGAISIIKFLFYVLFKKQTSMNELTFLHAKKITLESNSPCSIQADGDGIGGLPKKIKIMKRALSVVLPRA
jgi:YegS/Rv2252/BmrU family lipid kinase